MPNEDGSPTPEELAAQQAAEQRRAAVAAAQQAERDETIVRARRALGRLWKSFNEVLVENRACKGAGYFDEGGLTDEMMQGANLRIPAAMFLGAMQAVAALDDQTAVKLDALGGLSVSDLITRTLLKE